jgi:hypothetical protein
MILLEMMNENVNISIQIGKICSINGNDIKEINSMNIVICYAQGLRLKKCTDDLINNKFIQENQK